MRAGLERRLAAIIRSLLGRRNAVRVGRVLTDAGRLDGPNDMAFNGEREVQETVLRCSPPDRRLVVFDAGANVGDWTRQLMELDRARAGAGVVVHLFEPAPATHERLLANLEAWGLKERAVPVRRGLSDLPRTAELFVASALAGSNSLHRAGHGSSETIELTTFDAYCREAGVERIDLLKCDLEGHDLLALEGGRSLLERGAIEVLQFEYNWRWTGPHKLLKDAFALLVPLGYALGKITPLGIEFYPEWSPELETFKESNFLACRAQHVEWFRQVAWWRSEG